MNHLTNEDIQEFYSMLTPSALAALEQHEASKEHINLTMTRSIKLSESLSDDGSRQKFRDLFLQSLVATINDEFAE